MVILVWLALEVLLIGVGAYAAADGADGSATLIMMFIVWATVTLWPTLAKRAGRKA